MDTYSVLAKKSVPRVSPDAVTRAVDEARAKHNEDIAREVTARQAAEKLADQHRIAKEAVEAALADARSSLDKAQESVRQLTAEVERLKSTPPPAPVEKFVDRPVPTPMPDPDLKKAVESISRAVAALKPGPGPATKTPVRSIAGFDLQVTARDANNAILSLRATPITK